MSFNRLANVHNRFQNYNTYKRALCVCSAGLLRSPTLAWVLSNEPFNYNTRAAGADEEYALIPVDTALITWADIIVCVNQTVKDTLSAHFDLEGKPVIVLDIPDRFSYRDDELVRIISTQMGEVA